MNKIITKVITGLFVVLMMSTTAHAGDDSDSDSGNRGNKMYKVTITNLTQAQRFTPILVASSKKRVKLFDLGEAASPELAMLAEGGAVGPLTALLGPHTVDIDNSADDLPPHGLLEPGDSVTVMVSAKGARYISLASMLIPTNDAFFALNGVKVTGKKNTFMVKAYDAGSETNTETCADIPGPACGGEGFSPDDGEGYVYSHSGIHGHGSLLPETYDWNNPVARVEIVRVK